MNLKSWVKGKRHRLRRIMKCIFLRKQIKVDEEADSSESLATRDHSLTGFSTLTANGGKHTKTNASNIEEAESSPSESNYLNFEVEGLVIAQQELGQTMGELGLMFMKLVKFENQEAILDSQRRRATDMKNLATSTIKTSRLYRSLNDKTTSHLNVLHYYLGTMLAADHAFTERSSALLNVSNSCIRALILTIQNRKA